MIEKHAVNKTFDLKSVNNLKVIENIDNCVKYLETSKLLKYSDIEK